MPPTFTNHWYKTKLCCICLNWWQYWQPFSVPVNTSRLQKAVTVWMSVSSATKLLSMIATHFCPCCYTVIAKNTGCEMSKMYQQRIALVLLVTETDIYFGPVINAVTPPDENISTMIGQVLVQFLCSTTLFTSGTRKLVGWCGRQQHSSVQDTFGQGFSLDLPSHSQKGLGSMQTVLHHGYQMQVFEFRYKSQPLTWHPSK